MRGGRTERAKNTTSSFIVPLQTWQNNSPAGWWRLERLGCICFNTSRPFRGKKPGFRGRKVCNLSSVGCSDHRSPCTLYLYHFCHHKAAACVRACVRGHVCSSLGTITACLLGGWLEGWTARARQRRRSLIGDHVVSIYHVFVYLWMQPLAGQSNSNDLWLYAHILFQLNILNMLKCFVLVFSPLIIPDVNSSKYSSAF